METTTIEQSKRLLAAGIDRKTHDARWELPAHGEYKCVMGQSAAILDNLFSFRYGYEIPAWSYDALLKVLWMKSSVKIGGLFGRATVTCSFPGYDITVNGERIIEIFVQIYEQAAKQGLYK